MPKRSETPARPSSGAATAMVFVQTTPKKQARSEQCPARCLAAIAEATASPFVSQLAPNKNMPGDQHRIQHGGRALQGGKSPENDVFTNKNMDMFAINDNQCSDVAEKMEREIIRKNSKTW